MNKSKNNESWSWYKKKLKLKLKYRNTDAKRGKERTLASLSNKRSRNEPAKGAQSNKVRNWEMKTEGRESEKLFLGLYKH